MKKIVGFILVAAVLVGGIIWIAKTNSKKAPEASSQSTACQIKEITFYYLDGCEWCNKVKAEGTIEKIEQLGIKVNKVNAAIGPIRHKFQGVPTFVIGGKVYEGYRTFDEIKKLLVCPLTNTTEPDQSQTLSDVAQTDGFKGERGQKVAIDNEKIELDASLFSDNQAKFFNVQMPLGKTIYFFVVKDKNGIYRAAANACQVCFGTKKGFHQEGNEIVCNNCGNRYPVEKIATEKGGCNPGPINPNLTVQSGKIVINQADLEQIKNLF